MRRLEPYLFAPFHFSDLRFSVLSNAGLSQAFFYELGWP